MEETYLALANFGAVQLISFYVTNMYSPCGPKKWRFDSLVLQNNMNGKFRLGESCVGEV